MPLFHRKGEKKSWMISTPALFYKIDSSFHVFHGKAKPIHVFHGKAKPLILSIDSTHAFRHFHRLEFRLHEFYKILLIAHI